MQLDSASLHLAHALRPIQDVRLKPCSSIPLRFISLTGCALYNKEREGLCSCEHGRDLLFLYCAWLEPRMQI